MPDHPNILFLMTDQMQSQVLEADHPCITPNIDRLMDRGLRIRRAYTPNPVCSPARASLMTGLLPHTHGVEWVTQCVTDDKGNLWRGYPHWAQRLQAAGYQTAYFGKWHLDRPEDPTVFGWEIDGVEKSKGPGVMPSVPEHEACIRGTVGRPGYGEHLLYEVNDTPPEERMVGRTTSRALAFLDTRAGKKDPWCCFVSCREPHDPYVCGEESFRRYDVDALELPQNFHDDLNDKPGLYKKSGRAFLSLSDRQKREAMACYYASITELDQQYGRLLDFLQKTDQIEDTIVIFTSDHGDFLGAHGLYMKNTAAFEEAYQVPMVLSGPGICRGMQAEARVGLHDLAPTICELAGVSPLQNAESRSFAALLKDPAGQAENFTRGYAEYAGTRFLLTQRVIWDGPWKLVWNGFDIDELYNLEQDPFELKNLIDRSDCRPAAERLMKQAWRIVRDTNDYTLLRTGYPVLQLAPVGPGILDDNQGRDG